MSEEPRPPVHLPCVQAVEPLTDRLEGALDAETARLAATFADFHR